jgi:hypothetical protein
MDTHEKCVDWAASGECTHNAPYMLGKGTDSAGACRKACKVCTVCEQGDTKCYHNNRAQAGYLSLSEEVMQMTGRILPAQF